MANVRISHVTANSIPGTVRLSRVQAQTAAAPTVTVRLSRVVANNVNTGDIYVMQAGVWVAKPIKYRAAGAWV